MPGSDAAPRTTCAAAETTARGPALVLMAVTGPGPNARSQATTYAVVGCVLSGSLLSPLKTRMAS